MKTSILKNEPKISREMNALVFDPLAIAPSHSMRSCQGVAIHLDSGFAEACVNWDAAATITDLRVPPSKGLGTTRPQRTMA
jgi:hypothetical protein